MDFINIKTFCAPKSIIKKVNGQPIKREKILENSIPEKGKYKIYILKKTHTTQKKKKKTTNPIRKH